MSLKCYACPRYKQPEDEGEVCPNCGCTFVEDEGWRKEFTTEKQLIQDMHQRLIEVDKSCGANAAIGWMDDPPMKEVWLAFINGLETKAGSWARLRKDVKRVAEPRTTGSLSVCEASSLAGANWFTFYVGHGFM